MSRSIVPAILFLAGSLLFAAGNHLIGFLDPPFDALFTPRFRGNRSIPDGGGNLLVAVPTITGKPTVRCKWIPFNRATTLIGGAVTFAFTLWMTISTYSIFTRGL